MERISQQTKLQYANIIKEYIDGLSVKLPIKEILQAMLPRCPALTQRTLYSILKQLKYQPPRLPVSDDDEIILAIRDIVDNDPNVLDTDERTKYVDRMFVGRHSSPIFKERGLNRLDFHGDEHNKWRESLKTILRYYEQVSKCTVKSIQIILDRSISKADSIILKSEADHIRDMLMDASRNGMQKIISSACKMSYIAIFDRCRELCSVVSTQYVDRLLKEYKDGLTDNNLVDSKLDSECPSENCEGGLDISIEQVIEQPNTASDN